MLCDDLCSAQPSDPSVALAVASLARQVATAARYRLSSPLIAHCAQRAADAPEALAAELTALRSPLDRLWIEWSEQGQHVGVLAEAIAPNRRRWSVTLASIGERGRLMIAPLGFMADGSDDPMTGGVGPSGRIHPAPSPHMARFAQDLVDQGGMERLVQALAPFTKVLVAQSPFILAALLAAHLGDGVTASPMIPSDKLIKARKKSGKPAPLTYATLELVAGGGAPSF